MDEFLTESLSFPTVVFTVLLGIAGVYWLLVILGTLGLDVLDADHGGDAGHGDAGHGDAGHGDGGSGHAHGDPGIVAILLGPLKLNAVPMTIVVSMIAFWGWLVAHFLGHFAQLSHSNWFTEFLLLLAAFVAAVLITSLVIRPLAPLFRTNPAAHRSALVGKVVTIDTSRVDGEFGMARAEDGGAGLIVQVRCDASCHLTRGQRALVVSYDEVREVYEVTSLGDILPHDHPDSSGSPS